MNIDTIIFRYMTSKVSRKKTANIVNFYDVIPKKYLDETTNPNYELHHIELPFRMSVVAPSGSGKTNFVLNLLRVFGHAPGTFQNIHIVTANKDEPLYNYLESEFDNVKITEGLQTLPKLDDFDKRENSLVVVDDLVLERRLDEVEKYFIRCRKKNVSIAFLSQTYFGIPTVIRKNSSYLVILDLGGSNREIKTILNEWAGELDREVLFEMYHDAIREPLNPFIIKGGKCKNRNEKYRSGFSHFFNVGEYEERVRRREGKLKKKVVDDSSDDEN